MAIADEIISVMKEREAMIPQFFIWGGVSYSSNISNIQRGRKSIEGGDWLMYSGRISVRRSLLPSIPTEGMTITVDGETCYVGSVTSNSKLPYVVFEFSNTPPPK